MRDRMERWFHIGETVAFQATRDCVAGVFRLVQMEVKSPLSVVASTPDALWLLSRGGAAALNDPEVAPDVALLEIVNTDRTTGMTMRRAALEGRQCMDDHTESAFRYALDNPQSVLVFEPDPATFIVMDPGTGLLVVTMGAAEWL